MVAILAGRALDGHESPAGSTVHVLPGRVRLASGETTWPGAAGYLIAVPPERHTLEADDDSVDLLTSIVSP